MDYTTIDVEHRRAHLKQRITMIEDTHYRHSISIRLYEMSKVDKTDETYQGDLKTVSECEKVHKHLLELLAELPEPKEEETDAAP